MNGKWSIPIPVDRFFREARINFDGNQDVRRRWLAGVAIVFDPHRHIKARLHDFVVVYRMKASEEDS